MRIIYFGTPEFASYILEHLVKEKFNVVGVVTAPDRPAGRGRKLRPSAVRQTAESLLPNVPLLQPEKLRDEEFLQELEALRADLFIVVAFRMLPREVWAMPPRGSFNLHASLLPAYRGAAPIQHAILGGESTTGVTTFLLDEEIDTGRILLQEEVEILPTDTGGSLHDKLMEIGAQLVAATVRHIEASPEGTPLGTPQSEHGDLPIAPKIYKEDRLLSFTTQTAEQLHLRVRALSPYPAAYTHQLAPQEQEIKVYESAVLPSLPNATPGELHLINNGTGIAIQCLEGALEIIELQVPSKRRTSAADFLLGNTPEEGSRFE